MQHLLFLVLGLPVWVLLVAARKWSYRKHHAKHNQAFAQGTPIARLVSQGPDAPAHHWITWVVGTVVMMAAAYGLWWLFEGNKTSEFGFEVAEGLTFLTCAALAVAHGFHALPLPSSSYTLPEA